MIVEFFKSIDINWIAFISAFVVIGVIGIFKYIGTATKVLHAIVSIPSLVFSIIYGFSSHPVFYSYMYGAIASILIITILNIIVSVILGIIGLVFVLKGKIAY